MNDSNMNNWWNKYQNKYYYAKGVSFNDICSVINEILENYKKGIIDEELLEISKISLISGIEETEDSAGAYIAYMLRNYLANEDLTLEEAINKIAATTKEDIIKIAKGIHLDTIVLLSN